MPLVLKTMISPAPRMPEIIGEPIHEKMVAGGFLETNDRLAFVKEYGRVSPART